MSKRHDYPDADSLVRAETCPHGRQPSICAACVPLLERTFAGVPVADTTPRKAKVDQFPCVGCGACCSSVAHVPELAERGWVKDNGVCRHLDLKTNRCQIYESRPPVCDVMGMRPPLVSPSTWIQINLNVCDFLHRQQFEGAPLERSGTTCSHRRKIPKNAVPEPGDDLP